MTLPPHPPSSNSGTNNRTLHLQNLTSRVALRGGSWAKVVLVVVLVAAMVVPTAAVSQLTDTKGSKANNHPVATSDEGGPLVAGTHHPQDQTPSAGPTQTGAVVSLLTGFNNRTYAGSGSSAGPTITSVSFTGSSGSYGLSINGHGFGSPVVSLPYTGDVGNFRIDDWAQIGAGEWGYSGDAKTLTYNSWSDTSIQVNGFGGSPGDALTVEVWNSASGLGATWGGDVPGGPSSPTISSVAFSGSGASTTIQVQGSGFGNAPTTMPYSGVLNDFIFLDGRSPCGGGSSQFEAGGARWGHGSDSVALNYQSWSDSSITVDGFGSGYGSGCAVFDTGDPVSVVVWNSADSSQTGPQTSWGGFAGGSAPSTYSVTFPQSGLPAGTSWSVTLNGQTLSSTTSTITFSEPNGTYAYTVGAVNGYTATPSSGSVTVNGVSQTVAITFAPSSCVGITWQQCSAFSVSGTSASIPQIVGDAGYCTFPSPVPGLTISNPLCNSNLDSAVVSAYLIYPATTDSGGTFNSALESEFQASPPKGYSAQFALVLGLPVVPALNALGQDICVPWLGGCLNLPVEQLGPKTLGPTVAGITPTVYINSTGYINLIFVYSTTSSNVLQTIANSLDQSTFDPSALGKVLLDLGGAILKAGDVSDAINATERALEVLLPRVPDALNAISGALDLSISYLSPGLSSPLTSYPIFDFDEFLNSLATISTWYSEVNGVISTTLDLLDSVGHMLASLPTDVAIIPIALTVYYAAGVAFYSIELGVEVYQDLDPSGSSSVQALSGCLDAIAWVFDPDGSTLVPAYYNANGTVVLGFDTSTKSMIWASSAGVLIPGDDSFAAILRANGSSGPAISYTLKLYAVHPSNESGEAVPYLIQVRSYNELANPAGGHVSGIVPADSNFTLTIGTSGNGSVIPNPVARVVAQVSGSDGAYDVKATAYNQNGSVVGATSMYLLVNGNEYNMSSCGGPSFCYNFTVMLSGNTIGYVYASVPGMAGGMAFVVLNGTSAMSGKPPTFLGLPGFEGYILIGVIVVVVAAVVAVMLIRKRKGAQSTTPSRPQTLQQSPPTGPPPPP